MAVSDGLNWQFVRVDRGDLELTPDHMASLVLGGHESSDAVNVERTKRNNDTNALVANALFDLKLAAPERSPNSDKVTFRESQVLSMVDGDIKLIVATLRWWLRGLVPPERYCAVASAVEGK